MFVLEPRHSHLVLVISFGIEIVGQMYCMMTIVDGILIIDGGIASCMMTAGGAIDHWWCFQLHDDMAWYCERRRNEGFLTSILSSRYLHGT